MSVIKELKTRAAMALTHVNAALDPTNPEALNDLEKAKALLQVDAKGFMPGPAVDLTSPHAVSKLQEEFQAMRRRAGGIPAAMCIIAPQANKLGAFRFHFSGHDAVVKLLQGKAGLKVSPTPPPELDANGIKIQPPTEEQAPPALDADGNPEIKNEPLTPKELQDIDDGLDAAVRKEIAAKEKGLQELKEEIEIGEQATPAPVDMFAAKRAENKTKQPPTP